MKSCLVFFGFFASPCKFFLVLNQLFSLTQVIVLLKSWGGAVVGQSVLSKNRFQRPEIWVFQLHQLLV